MKGSLDFKPCTTLDQRRGSAEWCTTLRTCTMGPIVECGFCSAWLKETMCEFTAGVQFGTPYLRYCGTAVLQGCWSEPGQAASGTMANVTRNHGCNR